MNHEIGNEDNGKADYVWNDKNDNDSVQMETTDDARSCMPKPQYMQHVTCNDVTCNVDVYK